MNTNAVAQLLTESRRLIDELDWSRTTYVVRDSWGTPIAFCMVGALQYAHIQLGLSREAYLGAKLELERAVKPLSLTGFNRLARNKEAILGRFDAALDRVQKPSLAKVIPFPVKKKSGTNDE